MSDREQAKQSTYNQRRDPVCEISDEQSDDDYKQRRADNGTHDKGCKSFFIEPG
jgi:hypothetical protein